MSVTPHHTQNIGQTRSNTSAIGNVQLPPVNLAAGLALSEFLTGFRGQARR